MSKNKQILKHLQTHRTHCGYISNISEADFGCEERIFDQEVRARVELQIVKEEKLVKKVCEMSDQWLIDHDLDEDTYIPDKYREVFGI